MASTPTPIERIIARNPNTLIAKVARTIREKQTSSSSSSSKSSSSTRASSSRTSSRSSSSGKNKVEEFIEKLPESSSTRKVWEKIQTTKPKKGVGVSTGVSSSRGTTKVETPIPTSLTPEQLRQKVLFERLPPQMQTMITRATSSGTISTKAKEPETPTFESPIASKIYELSQRMPGRVGDVWRAKAREIDTAIINAQKPQVVEQSKQPDIPEELQTAFTSKINESVINRPISGGVNRVSVTWQTDTGEIKKTNTTIGSLSSGKFQKEIEEDYGARIVQIESNGNVYYKAPTDKELQQLWDEAYYEVYPEYAPKRKTTEPEEPEVIKEEEEETPYPKTIKYMGPALDTTGKKYQLPDQPDIPYAGEPVMSELMSGRSSAEIASGRPARASMGIDEYGPTDQPGFTFTRGGGGSKPPILPEIGITFGSIPEWIGAVDPQYKPVTNEKRLGSLESGQDFFIARGRDIDVLENLGYTPIDPALLDKKTMRENVNTEIKSFVDAQKDIKSTISNITSSTRLLWDIDKNADGIIQANETNLTKQQALSFYQNLNKEINQGLKDARSRKKAIEDLDRYDVVVYTKELNPVKRYVKDVTKTGAPEGVSWAISGWTPSGLVHDPLGIKTLVYSLRGKSKEEIAMPKARILASTRHPELGDVLYEGATPIGQAMGKFWGGAAGIVSAPVTIPQMGIKYARGEGELTDVMGRIETGKTFTPFDVGQALYKAGPHGKGQGLISVGFSELLTGGESPAWEQAQEDPWGSFWATAGELTGMYGLGYGAKTISTKFPRAWKTYSTYRPSALIKSVPKQIIEGVRRPSITGALRKGISKLPKLQTKFETITGKPTTITSKWTSGLGKTKGIELSRSAIFTRRILQSPTMKKAISWAEKGSQEVMPRTMWGVKPMIRNLAYLARKSPKVLSKLRESAKVNLNKKIDLITKEISRYKEATKNITAESSIDDIVSASKKVYGSRVAKEIKNALDDGIYTKNEIIGLLDDSIKGFESEVNIIGKVLRGEKVPLSEKIEYRYAPTASEKILAWAEGQTRPPRLRHMLRGKIHRPQQYDFYMGEGQYPQLTEAELLSSFEGGGWHMTSGVPKRYAVIKNLSEQLDDAVRASKTPKSVDAVLKLGNPIDDVTYEALIKDQNLIFSGSRAMKLQTKLSVAKIKRFFGKESDVDLIYKGDYLKTGQVAKEIAEELSTRTGEKYVATTQGVAHEGTWTIKTPTGKRVMDITSYKSPSTGLLRSNLKDAVPIEEYTRNIGGVSVADPAYLMYNYLDMAALKSIVPKQIASKAEASISAMKGKTQPEYGIALGSTPETSVMVQRVSGIAKLKEKYSPFKYKTDTILGRGTRWTTDNPAQYELFHQSPVATRWPLGLKGEVQYEPTLFSFRWKAKPRGLYDPTRGIAKGEMLRRLKEAEAIGEASGPRGAEAYMIELSGFTNTSKPIPAPSYKGLAIYRKGGEFATAEAERVYPAFQVQMKTGYTPLAGKFIELTPSPRIRPTSIAGRLGEAYGEAWGRVSGWRHYTVDIPTGRTIRYYPTIPKYITPRERIGYTKEKDIMSETATQPVMPKPEIPKGVFYAERHLLSPSQIGSELASTQKYAMTYRQPVGYKSSLSSISSIKPQEERRVRKVAEEEYRVPTYTYKPAEVPKISYDYERPTYEEAGYEEPYERPYERPEDRPEPYEYKAPYRPILSRGYEPYGYYTPRPYKQPAPPRPIPPRDEEEETKRTPRTRKVGLGYFERKYKTPDIWKAGTTKAKFGTPKKQVPVFPSKVKLAKPKSTKLKTKEVKKPEFFSLTGGI